MLLNLNLMNSDISQHFEFQIQSGRHKYGQKLHRLSEKYIIKPYSFVPEY